MTATAARARGKPSTRERSQTHSSAADRAYARRAGRTAPRSVSRSARNGFARQAANATRTPSRAQQTYSRASFVVLVIALLCTGIAATLWLSTQATADSYRLEHLTKSTDHLRQRVDDTQRYVMRHESPQSLARRAKAMGMVPAQDPAKLVVGADGNVRVIKPEKH
jgi:hypothetical protein